jgi:hypothetical protein
MMKKILFLKTLAIGLLFFVSGCKKYDDGGWVSKADKRIVEHPWRLESYYENGVEKTGLLLISSFTESFNSDGAMSRTFIDSNGDLVTQVGTWNFDSNKYQIKLNGVGSVELTNETNTVSTSDYNIIRLKNHELWYEYENGGVRHEFHMIK